jgi:hypothetical protein
LAKDAQHIKEYIKQYAVCQKNKAENIPCPGLLQPFLFQIWLGHTYPWIS